LPQSSLNGLVVTKHADLKLTNQTTRDLSLGAGFKFNERDNQTASNTYNFYDLAHVARTAISTPLSNRKTQLELAGDYRIDARQKLHVGYEYEQIKRWCDQSPTLAQVLAASLGLGSTDPTKTAAAAYYAQGVSCVQVPQSKENKLAVNYMLKASDDVNVTAGYVYSRRKADINAAFYNPMQSVVEGFELPGYVAYFDASRTEQTAKAGVNWQTSEQLSVNLNGRYVKDAYDSTLGVQSGQAWGANLDAMYSIAEKSSVSAYLNLQNRKRDLLNDAWGHTTTTYGTAIASGSAIQPWTNSLTSSDTTVGIAGKQGGLMGGALDLAADLTYALSKSTYSTTVNYTNAACTATSNGGYVCGTLPDIKSTMVQLKLTGDYKLDKSRKIVIGYMYQHLKADDYYYNAYQTGYTPTGMLPTNQQAPSYSVNVVTASYLYNF
jgi:MtrB/PioB family decaheme-associated outer membrane protein